MSTTTVVESWTEGPLVRFVTQSSARLVLVMTPAGQVLAQHGFTKAVEVMSAAALGAAIMASSTELAKQVGEARFGALYHAGHKHGIHLAGCETPRGKLVVLTVFGKETSIGLVQLFFEEFTGALSQAAPLEAAPRAVLAADFEDQLNSSLATLFRR